MTQPAKPRSLQEQSPFKIELRPDLWGGRLSPRDREVLTQVAEKYALDPLTGEVMMLRGKVYITAAGLQKLAVRDPDYEGCEIEIVQADWEKNFYVIKARVWKKGCAHAFEDFGDADPSTSSLRGRALFRHAITRARARAMRSAFAIPFCSLEELDGESRAAAQGAGPSGREPRAVPSQSTPRQTPRPRRGEGTSASPAPASNPAPSRKRGPGRAEEPREQDARALGERLHRELLAATDVEQLKGLWGEFQEVRGALSEDMIQKICAAKDQKKSNLSKES